MYDELYKTWKEEKENREVQGLPRDFYVRVAEYVKKIRVESRMLDDRTTKGSLIQHELANVERMVMELVQSRYKKTLETVTAEKVLPRERLTEEEINLFTEFLLFTESHRAFLNNLLRGRLVTSQRREFRHMIVCFLKDVPAVLGSDKKTYGPFKSEDVATLPPENARILIKQGAALEIETR